MKKALLPRPARNSDKKSLIPANVSHSRFACGQAVTVCEGALKGATGVVLKAGNDHRWLVKLDDSPAGVLLSIRAAALRLAGRRFPRG